MHKRTQPCIHQKNKPRDLATRPLVSSRLVWLACSYVGRRLSLSIVCYVLWLFIVQSLCPRERLLPSWSPVPQSNVCLLSLSHVGSAWMACCTRLLMACTSTSVPEGPLLDWSRLSYLTTHIPQTQRERVRGTHTTPTEQPPSPVPACMCSLSVSGVFCYLKNGSPRCRAWLPNWCS